MSPPILTAGGHTLNRRLLLLLLLLLMLLVTARCSSGQSPSLNNPYNTFPNANFNPTMAILIIVSISAIFFLGFFSLYLCQCATASSSSSAASAAAAVAPCWPRGLDPAVLATFPTLIYSEAKSHNQGTEPLECAVCLCEFNDDGTLRLLPKCNHVFHPECIDAWLASHVTCPVCRFNLSEPVAPIQEPVMSCPEDVTIELGGEDGDQRRSLEIDRLEQFVNLKRVRSQARPVKFPRSHSTGHYSVVGPGEDVSRFTLTLPDNVRKEVLERTRSLVVLPREGSSRGGRLERWGSVFMRTLSVKGVGFFRRGEAPVKGEGSSKEKGGSFRPGESMKGEGSTPRGVRFCTDVGCSGGTKAESVGSMSESQAPMKMLDQV